MTTTEAPRGRQPEPARLVIADDHELARAGLRSILGGEPDLVVVGEATNAEEAIDLCSRLRPDLVLMDVRMPGRNGLAATAAIRKVSPATNVVIVTIYAEPDYLQQALQAGAAGYLRKDASRREILAAVRQVLRGEAALEPGLAAQLLRRLAREPARAADTAHAPERVESLTARERDVLRLLAQGQTNQEIAANLGIGAGTVKAHVERIIAKLGAADRTQAAVRAQKLGLLGLDQDL